jgi:hypothetical protein
MNVRSFLGGCFLSVLPASAAAQRLGGTGEPDVSIVRTFLALLLCLVIALLAVLLIRYRLGGRLPLFITRMGPVDARVSVIESRRISPQAEVSLIACDGEEFLVLLSPGGPLLLRRDAAGSGSGERA